MGLGLVSGLASKATGAVSGFTGAAGGNGEGAGGNERKIVKAVITNTATGESLTVGFNPSEYTISRRAVYSENAPLYSSSSEVRLTFVRRKQMEVNLLFDTTDTGEDVSKQTDILQNFMDAVGSGDELKEPILIFNWNAMKFVCVLEDLALQFIRFDPKGIPLRVIAKCVFSEYAGEVSMPEAAGSPLGGAMGGVAPDFPTASELGIPEAADSPLGGAMGGVVPDLPTESQVKGFSIPEDIGGDAHVLDTVFEKSDLSKIPGPGGLGGDAHPLDTDFEI